MEKITDKEKYELWWGYLLESEKYRAYCEFQSKKQEEFDLPSMGLRLTFDFFGDVFSSLFENWWATRKDKDPGIGVIEYTRQQAEYEFNKTVKEFMRSHGREPSLNEFREMYIDRLLNHLPASFLLRVHLHPAKSTKDLIDQYRKIVREKREQPDIQKWEIELKKGWLPIVGRFRYDELKRYIKVY